MEDQKAVITWGDFKKSVESKGVKDETVLDWIDWTSGDDPEIGIGGEGQPVAIS